MKAGCRQQPIHTHNQSSGMQLHGSGRCRGHDITQAIPYDASLLRSAGGQRGSYSDWLTVCKPRTRWHRQTMTCSTLAALRLRLGVRLPVRLRFDLPDGLRVGSGMGSRMRPRMGLHCCPGLLRRRRRLRLRSWSWRLRLCSRYQRRGTVSGSWRVELEPGRHRCNPERRHSQWC